MEILVGHLDVVLLKWSGPATHILAHRGQCVTFSRYSCLYTRSRVENCAHVYPGERSSASVVRQLFTWSHVVVTPSKTQEEKFFVRIGGVCAGYRPRNLGDGGSVFTSR